MALVCKVWMGHLAVRAITRAEARVLCAEVGVPAIKQVHLGVDEARV